jgi:galactokinase
MKAGWSTSRASPGRCITPATRCTAGKGSLAGDVPVGAGLSSSAALEMAVARAFAAAGGFPWDAAAMARAGQRAENEWVGVNCGIMDQMISAAAVAGQALLIDCRTLETTPCRCRRRR